MGWINPTGYNDPSGCWVSETQAYNDNTNDWAAGYTNTLSWSCFLELTINTIVCSKIRVYATNDLVGYSIIHDIDVYYDDTWHDIYQGSLPNKTWREISLGGAYSITKVRFRGFNPLSSDPINITLCEIDFYQEIAPTVTTQAVSDILSTTATGNGNITDIGSASPTKRGICWNKTGNPTVADNKSEETGSFGTGAFTRPMTGLEPGTHYYVKAYAYNLAGYGYGGQVEFTTNKVAPTVITKTTTNIATTTATANGEITATGGEDCSERGFQYGLTKVATWTVKDIVGGYGTGAYSKGLTGLTPNTIYWIRAYAKNSMGTSYGEWVSFHTAVTGATPTNTRITLTGDVSGYISQMHSNYDTDLDYPYDSYFVIATDLSQDNSLKFYKRLLTLDNYLRKESAGTITISIKCDHETDWRKLGDIDLTGTADIVVPYLAVDELGKHFLIKFSGKNVFRYLGTIFEFVIQGER